MGIATAPPLRGRGSPAWTSSVSVFMGGKVTDRGRAEQIQIPYAVRSTVLIVANCAHPPQSAGHASDEAVRARQRATRGGDAHRRASSGRSPAFGPRALGARARQRLDRLAGVPDAGGARTGRDPATVRPLRAAARAVAAGTLAVAARSLRRPGVRQRAG